jgi:hypothetical protein
MAQAPLLAGFVRKSAWIRADFNSLHCESFATFGAPRIEHSATAFGFHANPKSMGSFATRYRWLICSFHD